MELVEPGTNVSLLFEVLVVSRSDGAFGHVCCSGGGIAIGLHVSEAGVAAFFLQLKFFMQVHFGT